MTEPLEDTYFRWLCAKVVADVNSPDYIQLLLIFHHYEFVPLLPGDHNRAEEGLGVRSDFLRETHYDTEPEWGHIGCSMLEMLIGLAKQAAWQASSPMRDWFWKFVQNLGLEELRRVGPTDVQVVEDALYAVVWRTYDDNGNGGIFPLRSSQYDQRMFELWYQFSEYVSENDLM